MKRAIIAILIILGVFIVVHLYLLNHVVNVEVPEHSQRFSGIKLDSNDLSEAEHSSLGRWQNTEAISGMPHQIEIKKEGQGLRAIFTNVGGNRSDHRLTRLEVRSNRGVIGRASEDEEDSAVSYLVVKSQGVDHLYTLRSLGLSIEVDRVCLPNGSSKESPLFVQTTYSKID